MKPKGNGQGDFQEKTETEACLVLPFLLLIN